MEIGYVGINNKNKSIWTYDLIDNFVIKLETIIALPTLTYIVETNMYEIHPMNE